MMSCLLPFFLCIQPSHALELDIFKQGEVLRKTANPQKPYYYLLPPMQSNDQLNDFETKYLGLQVTKLIDDMKAHNAAIRAVDGFTRNPPKIEIMNVKTGIYYDVSNGSIIAKSEYGDTVLKESFLITSRRQEFEFSHIIEHVYNFRWGVKFTTDNIEDRTTLFIEKHF